MLAQRKFSKDDDIEGGGGSHFSAVAYSHASWNPLPAIGILSAVVICLVFLFPAIKHITIVLGVGTYGLIFSLWLCRWVLAKDDGTSQMRAISEPIRDGAHGFLKVQYTAVFKIAIFVAAGIFGSYHLRPQSDHPHGIDTLGSNVLGMLGAFTFALGAGASATTGYVTMLVSAQTNIRVASAARRSYGETLLICFRGGAFSAILALAMCIGSITILYCVIYMLYVPSGRLTVGEVPLLIVGYGFGASFVALFMQLGGGIYTKAADVGADLVGKIEAGIPEDDPRNPAVIADLVGDMVGDCVGSSADVFESISAEIIGAMILGGVIAKEGAVDDPVTFVFFPIVVHAFDIVVSSIGILSVTGGDDADKDPDPMRPLTRGYMVACTLAIIAFAFSCRWLLYTSTAPAAWMHYAACGGVGMLTALVFVKSTQYYTDYEYYPVQAIAKASTTGHGTNIIVGTAFGLKSVVVPVFAVSIAVLTSYHLGRTSGIGSGHNAGLFGTAVATMGMLSSAAYILAMNNFGPIADNAGGIAEMSQQPEHVRATTDRLDAAGNVTKAITKGYSIGSAALACFLLFGAFLNEFEEFAGRPFHTVDIAKPPVLIGGLLGVMMIFYFAGLAIAAVGSTAGEVVDEVRRQLKESPEIMEGTVSPDYKACVSIVTEAALREMRYPGLLAVCFPVMVGIFFRGMGSYIGDPLLGAEVLAGFLMFATVSGIMLSLFFDNVGGAWDNAKKYIEMGHFGGKGSEAHKAAVTGDTVGDPFKDTAGPSLHVVIKLLSTTILVLAPLFINSTKV